MNFANPQDDARTSGQGGAADPDMEIDSAYMEGPAKPPQVSKGMLGALGAAVAVGAVVLAMRMGGPKAAAAAEADAPPDDAVAAYLSNGEEHAQLMKQMLQNTEKVVQRFRAYNAKTQVPLASLHKNPFRQANLLPAKPVAESDAAAKRRQEQERADVLEAAQKLHLQSVMHGGSRQACMINNTMYLPGQTVDGFTVEQIGPDGVVVRAKGHRVLLGMPK